MYQIHPTNTQMAAGSCFQITLGILKITQNGAGMRLSLVWTQIPDPTQYFILFLFQRIFYTMFCSMLKIVAQVKIGWKRRRQRGTGKRDSLSSITCKNIYIVRTGCQVFPAHSFCLSIIWLKLQLF